MSGASVVATVHGYREFKNLLAAHKQTKRSVTRAAIAQWKALCRTLYKLLQKDSCAPLIEAHASLLFDAKLVAVCVCCGDESGLAILYGEKITALCKQILETALRSALVSIENSCITKFGPWVFDQWDDLRAVEEGIVAEILFSQIKVL